MKKKLSGVFLAIGMTLAVAGSVVFAQLRSGSYGPLKAGSIAQTAATEAAPDANYGVSSFPSFAPEMADGEGRQETESFCAMCHSTRYITMQPPLSPATWEAEMNKMIKTYGAPIPDVTAKKIQSYLQAHYALENRTQ